MSQTGPVPGRECGACDACCVLFEINEPAIAKAAGERCRNLTARGCAIHDTRPQTCRAWLCGWRLIAGLPEDWRPDLSGILVYQMKSHAPGYGADAFIISLNRGLAHLDDIAVLGFVQNMVRMRLPLYLARHKGRAKQDAVFLNDRLEPSVQSGDAAAFVAVLARSIEELEARS